LTYHVDASPDAAGSEIDTSREYAERRSSGSGRLTVSTWVGTNVAADLPYIDITNQLAPFDTPDELKDARGFPVEGASGTSTTDVGFILPSGRYNISYRGEGTVLVAGIGNLASEWESVDGERRNAVNIVGTPGSFGGVLVVAIFNLPGQSVQDLHILCPGFDYATTRIFMPGFLNVLRPFRSMRFMDWMRTGAVAQLSEWSQAPKVAGFGKSVFGESYANIVALVNETGKDVWVNIPPNATDDFVRRFADFLRDGLDFTRIQQERDRQGLSAPFQLMFEYGNEVWDPSSPDYGALLAIARADPQRYDGQYTGSYGPSWMVQIRDLMKVGQAQADRVVQIANIFREEFSAIGKSEIIAPVLGGWSLGAAFSDVGLRFIENQYGSPQSYVSYIAIGTYFGPAGGQTGDLDTLFASMSQNIQEIAGTFQDFRQLADEYRVKMTAYEGGQGLNGPDDLYIKHLAQYDRRMYSGYIDFFALWKKHFGEALFNHYWLASIPGLPEHVYQYGFWGSIDSVLDDPSTCGRQLVELSGRESIPDLLHRYCPKYQALQEQVLH
jgi:hypothetical protein